MTIRIAPGSVLDIRTHQHLDANGVYRFDNLTGKKTYLPELIYYYDETRVAQIKDIIAPKTLTDFYDQNITGQRWVLKSEYRKKGLDLNT